MVDLSEISDRDWFVTLILALFGGGIGLHRFYVGKIGTAILYIFTLGFCGIGVVVDLIMIVCKKFKDKDGYLICKSKV